MSRALLIHRVGPGVTPQDLGRQGYLDSGLSRGGAADRQALHEGAALLGQNAGLAAMEMAGMGGEFEAMESMRIALTGAPMRATLDGTNLTWNASHLLPAGARLSIGPVLRGSYGYLHLGGGILGPVCLGAQSTHLSAGIGRAISQGDRLAVGPDKGTQIGMTFDPDDRFSGGTIRLIASFQTGLFTRCDLERFCTRPLRRDARSNRMGMRLNPEGGGFQAEGARNVISEAILPGDIQITGDGTPFALLAECQTTGGYPRIGTVLPSELSRLAQTPSGAEVRFRFVERDEAMKVEAAAAKARAQLRTGVRPLIRDPHKMSDLLSYQLISGAISGFEIDN